MGLANQVAQVFMQAVGGTGVRITRLPAALVGPTVTTGKSYAFSAACVAIVTVAQITAVTALNYRIAGAATMVPNVLDTIITRLGTGLAAG